MSYPNNRNEVIALIWLRSQDLSGLTPAETAQKFKDALKEINEKYPPEASDFRIPK